MTLLTLSAIKEHVEIGTPSDNNFTKLLDKIGKNVAENEAVQISHILELVGLDHTLWYLRALPTEYDCKKRLLAASCAKRVLWIFEKHFPFYSAPQEAINVASLFAEKKISDEALSDAEEAVNTTMYHLTSLPVYNIELRGNSSMAIWDAASAAKYTVNKNPDTAVLMAPFAAASAAQRNAKWYERKKIHTTEINKQCELLLGYFGDNQP